MAKAKPGRPKSTAPAPEVTMVRIGKETNQLAREAGSHFGEGIAAYVDRVVRERTEKDLMEIARKRAGVAGGSDKGKGGQS